MAAMQARSSGFNPNMNYGGSALPKGEIMDENVSQMYRA
jgi:hypothetical protein